MKRIALAAALATAIPTATLADTSTRPVMDPVFIAKNSAVIDDDLLAPVLFIAFVLAAMAATAAGSVVVVSDARLKTDVTRIGTAANGLPLYHFRYLGQSRLWEGVMAQDVLAHTPEAVVDLGGYLGVNYDMLGLEMRAVD